MDDKLTIGIPEFCLLLLVGPSGAGKTTFARRHFQPTEILSADAYRGIVSDDPDSIAATADAFAVIHDVAARRLRRRLLTVIDATNLNPAYRKVLVEIARQCYAPAIAVILDVSERTCNERNRTRADRRHRQVIRRHVEQARGVLKTARREGFAHVHKIPEAQLDAVAFDRQRLWTDRRDERGPFDIVGDVHGCLDELLALVTGPLGYMVAEVTRPSGRRGFAISHPEGRRLVSLGDLADRGPDSPGVLAFWMDACADGAALAVKGNHDQKLLRHLRGGEVSRAHGFDRTVAQLADAGEKALAEYRAFIDGLTSHLVLDGGALAVAHAGVKAEMQAKAGRLVSDFCLYGETSGELDEFGLPVRHDWAAGYAGKAAVVYGHTPVPEAQWVGNTICIDTGCVFGGKLAALRWPERETVSAPATRVYYEPVRPMMLPPSAQLPSVQSPLSQSPLSQSPSRLPDAAALTGTAMIETRYGRQVSVQPEQAAAAFEILARFAADPRWLIHVPPTTATVEASAAEGWLERPEEAFRHYRAAGLAKVCVQEKHMGSRAVAIACRDADVARQRFGDGTRLGAVLSKGGRPYFDDPADEAFLVDAIRAAMDGAAMWDELGTGWVALDGEALPWNAKAGSLIRDTFAATASAGVEAARAAANAYGAAAARGSELAAALATQASAQGAAVAAFRRAYGVFVVPYGGIDDLRFAPFHVLASEAGVHAGESHRWHMEIAERLALKSNVIVPTEWREVTLADTAQCEATALWWDEMTAAGREGFVVKGPHLALLPNGVAPSIKVRGKEYLRIIYGAEYDRPDILPALKKRATGRKRALARIGTSLGLESLARFVERASASRVHEVVAASLAVASEPLDSRL